MSQAQTLTLDGITYDLSNFSDEVRAAVGIYNAFNSQLAEERLAVMKTESALAHLGTQLAARAAKELADKKAEPEAVPAV